MTDRPIIFSGPMIRALLDGQKTQTRRLLKPQPSGRFDFFAWNIGEFGNYAHFVHQLNGSMDVKLPAWRGDRLWVQETFTKTQYDDPVYRADARDSRGHRWSSITPGDPDNEVLWKSSTQMPRWASRITLTVTDVRVQRLQDIDAEDAEAEGCLNQVNTHCGSLVKCYGPDCPTDPVMSCNQHGCWGIREDFRDLWNSLHGDDAWSLNPWVVAITFTVHKGNIDQVSV